MFQDRFFSHTQVPAPPTRTTQHQQQHQHRQQQQQHQYQQSTNNYVNYKVLAWHPQNSFRSTSMMASDSDSFTYTGARTTNTHNTTPTTTPTPTTATATPGLCCLASNVFYSWWAQQIVPSWSFMFCQLIIPFCVVRFHLCTRETMCLCCNVKFHSVAQVLFGLFNIITAIFVEATLPLDSTIGVAGLNSHITC